LAVLNHDGDEALAFERVANPCRPDRDIEKYGFLKVGEDLYALRSWNSR
jgi:hypothetical protein